jgi:DNA-binding NarL/FixJ family response regulator
MRILLVDPHILFREGLTSLLVDYSDLEVVGQVGCAAEVIATAQDTRPDIVLTESVLPDGSGIELIRPLQTLGAEIKVVILTNQDSDELMFSALRAGARGFIHKDSSISKVVASLRAVERNEVALTRTMTSRVVEELRQVDSSFYRDPSSLNSLTTRERQILLLLREDFTNQEIAERLNVTINTTKVHIHNILEKLHLQNRREAASFARRHLDGPTEGFLSGGE